MARRTKVRIVCAIGFLCAVSLSAQEVVRDTITGKVHQIEKVTVTARRLPNKVTSSVPIQTLSQQDISQRKTTNIYLSRLAVAHNNPIITDSRMCRSHITDGNGFRWIMSLCFP